MSPSRLFAPLLCVVVAVTLIGCSATPTTRTATDFSSAALDRVAVVFTQSDIDTKNFAARQTDTAAVAWAEAEVPRLMKSYAPHFGVTLVDARVAADLDPAAHTEALEAFAEAIRAIREENRAISDLPYAEGKQAGRRPLSNAIADEVGLLAEHTESRYLLSVAVEGWSASEAEKVLDALLVAGGGLLGAVIAGGPNDLTTIETAIVDAKRGEVVWYSTRGAVLDPGNPEHLRALTQAVTVELFSGNYIPPFSFSAKLNQDAVVYLVDGGRVIGHVTGPEDLYFTVDTRDGEQRVRVEDVKSIRSFTGTGRLFPRNQ